MAFKVSVGVNPYTVNIGGHTHEIVWPSHDQIGFDDLLIEFPLVRDAILKHCKRQRSIVQAGGFSGIFALGFSDCFESVFSFEPDVNNFVILQNNCKKIPTRIRTYPVALGEHSGHCNISRNSLNLGMTRVVSGNDVPMTRIDDLGLTDCDAIQLDVEGYEMRVLRGAVETLKASWPVVTVETCHPGTETILGNLGYILKERAGGDYIFVKD